MLFSQLLISAGADIDGEDENGDTAFVHAFQKRHIDVLKLLHAAGCQTEIVKMSIALASKDISFIRLCRELDIPVENEDWATTDLEGIRILVDELQLDPYQSSYGNHSFDDSPFMYLTQEGKPEVLELLIGKKSQSTQYSQQQFQDFINQALIRAAKYGRLDNVKILLSSGAKLSSIDTQGRSVFIVACGHSESVALYLIQAGADIFVEDSEGLSALHWAACAGYEQLCRSLILKEVDINHKAKHGATPLMVACSTRHENIVRIFLANNADVAACTPDGWTALHVAVRCAAHSIVKSLLRHGADPDVQAQKLTHNLDIVPANSPLLIAIALNSIRMINHLVDANCNINLFGLVCIDVDVNISGCELLEGGRHRVMRCSPIQFAIVSHAWDVAELLIKLGCNVVEIQTWLEVGKCPFQIPDVHRHSLRSLVAKTTSSPKPLSHLARWCIRKQLGSGLLGKLDQLHLTDYQYRFLLFHDLFAHALGSFEI